VARVDATTYNQQRIRTRGKATHFSLRFKARAPASPTAPAIISSCVMHFERDAQEDSG